MPTENQYAAPTAVGQVDSGPDSDRDWLRKIAAAQRHTNIAVLCYLCLIPANVAIQKTASKLA